MQELRLQEHSWLVGGGEGFEAVLSVEALGGAFGLIGAASYIRVSARNWLGQVMMERLGNNLTKIC